MALNKGRKRSRGLAVLGLALVFPLFFGRSTNDVRFSIDFQGEVPGLRYRNDPGSLFKRSATAFETELGMSTANEISGAVAFLASRYGIQAACAPVRVVDVFNSNFLTGDIRLTDGAWAIYTAADLAGGPCPTTTLEPRQPSLYLETIIQKGDFFVQMSVGDIRVPIQPQVKLVQALIFANKPGIVLGGTFAAEHGAYDARSHPARRPPRALRRHPLRRDALQLGRPERDRPLRVARALHDVAGRCLSTRSSRSRIRVSARASTRRTTRVTRPRGVPDPELTGNAVLGIPRNPILTPRTINFLYTGVGRFPHSPALDRHVNCVNDFSDPNNLKVCPPRFRRRTENVRERVSREKGRASCSAFFVCGFHAVRTPKGDGECRSGCVRWTDA